SPEASLRFPRSTSPTARRLASDLGACLEGLARDLGRPPQGLRGIFEQARKGLPRAWGSPEGLGEGFADGAKRAEPRGAGTDPTGADHDAGIDRGGRPERL